MASTTRNMWKVVCDKKCGAIVMLSDLMENGMVRIIIMLDVSEIVEPAAKNRSLTLRVWLCNVPTSSYYPNHHDGS